MAKISLYQEEILNLDLSMGVNRRQQRGKSVCPICELPWQVGVKSNVCVYVCVCLVASEVTSFKGFYFSLLLFWYIRS